VEKFQNVAVNRTYGLHEGDGKLVAVVKKAFVISASNMAMPASMMNNLPN